MQRPTYVTSKNFSVRWRNGIYESQTRKIKPEWYLQSHRSRITKVVAIEMHATFSSKLIRVRHHGVFLVRVFVMHVLVILCRFSAGDQHAVRSNQIPVACETQLHSWSWNCFNSTACVIQFLDKNLTNVTDCVRSQRQHWFFSSSHFCKHFSIQSGCKFQFCVFAHFLVRVAFCSCRATSCREQHRANWMTKRWNLFVRNGLGYSVREVFAQKLEVSCSRLNASHLRHSAGLTISSSKRLALSVFSHE